MTGVARFFLSLSTLHSFFVSFAALHSTLFSSVLFDFSLSLAHIFAAICNNFVFFLLRLLASLDLPSNIFIFHSISIVRSLNFHHKHEKESKKNNHTDLCIISIVSCLDYLSTLANL